MKKTILFLGMILVLIATPLFSQDKGVQDIENTFRVIRNCAAGSRRRGRRPPRTRERPAG